MADANSAVFVRATITTPAGAFLTNVSLPHLSGGLFGADYTFTTPGHFSVVFRAYIDAPYTIPAQYDIEAEQVEVTPALSTEIWDSLLSAHMGTNSMGEAMSLMRGLMQHNFILDNTTHNGKGLLTAGRIRIFPTAADVDAETNTLATYDVVTTPELAPNDNLTQRYRVKRLP